MQTIPAGKSVEKLSSVQAGICSCEMHQRCNDGQRKKVDMEMYQNGVEVFVIIGHCNADDEK